MENLKENFKHEQITALGEAIQVRDSKKAYEIALKLITFCEKFQVTEEDLCDLVEAYSIANSFLRDVYPFKTSKNNTLKMLPLLKRIKNVDDWKIQKYEEVLDHLKLFGSLQAVYDTYLDLINAYRISNDIKQLENTYARLVAYLTNINEDVLNFASRVDGLDIKGIKSQVKNHAKYINSDPVEKTKKYTDVYVEAEEKTHEAVGEPGRMGYVYLFWPKLKEILKNDHDIDWAYPGLLNDARFD